MFNAFIKSLTLFFIAIAPAFLESGCSGCNACFGDCCQSFEVGIGWRRDSLDWELQDVDGSIPSYYFNTYVDDHIHFEDIDMYTAYTKMKWVGEAFYVRLAAQYGTTEKGRAEEHFVITSPVLGGTVGVFTENPIKRRSEVYDFIGAVGYPFTFYNQSLMVTPLIGFSYHRQRLRVDHDDHGYCYCPCFEVESSNPFGFPDTSSSFSEDSSFSASNPFSSRSSPSIPSAIGLRARCHSESIRFTWYGFSLGVDLAYALDPCWTIYSEFEWHFNDRCNRKRHSHTGVDFIDDYHRRGWASGINTTIGTAWDVGNSWYATISVDYKYWWSYLHNDHLDWSSVGINAALGYVF